MTDGGAAGRSAPAAPRPWDRLPPGSVPRLLDGYLVLRELGRPAMGPVYLASPLWQNHKVTFRVMKLLWARNASFVACFTRDVFAAAQLRHHNLAAIVDFGEARGTTYFCTEHVNGQSLAELTRQKERLGAQEAAGYILHAARGLRCAHDQGLIHRDITPERVVVDRQGLVKVGELGLVNTPELALASEAILAGKAPAEGATGGGSGSTTWTDVAVGTPSYMAPEQAGDATRVDPRADIYSLGCTLYFLVTGRPPFEGGSAIEILNKHQTEPLIPPDQVGKDIPGSLSAILFKMLAKKPEERYANLTEVIGALERFLGITSSGTFTPRPEQAELIEACAAAFDASRSARLRSWVMAGTVGACLVLALLSLLAGRPAAGGVLAALALATALADFVLVGTRRDGPLFAKACELVSRARLSEWLTAAAALAILVALLLIVKMFWIALGLTFLAVGIAVAIHAAFDRQADAEQYGPPAQAQAMVRSLRLQGHDEDTLRQFVCVYGGDHWEALYEALFGYEAKREAKSRWRHDERRRLTPQVGVLRDLVADWLDARITVRRAAEKTATLCRIEERHLLSQGENLVSARRKARRSALAMVAAAAELKESLRAGARDAAIMVNRSIAWTMREASLRPEKVLLGHEYGLLPERAGERLSPVRAGLTTLLGPKVRFLAGAALLAGCLAWMHQNAMISAEHAAAFVEAAKSGDVEAIQSHAEAGIAHARQAASQPTRALDLPGVPRGVLALASSFGAGAGGLILIVSSLFTGIRIAFFTIPAAAIPVLLPRLWHPALAGLDPSVVPSILGAAVLAAGVLLARR